MMGRWVSITIAALFLCSGSIYAQQGASEQASPIPFDQREQVHLGIDPMRAGDCRLKPDVLGNFVTTDTLHAFVRLYPPEKIDKGKPEQWMAKFALRWESGTVEAAREIPFTSDSGSGYLASIEMPLNVASVTAGQHVMDVEVRGPGTRRDLKQWRQISIVAAATP